MEYISDQIQDITGYLPSDLIDNFVCSFASIVHPDDLEMIRKAIEKAKQDEKNYEIEYRLMHKNGSIVWFVMPYNDFRQPYLPSRQDYRTKGHHHRHL